MSKMPNAIFYTQVGISVAGLIFSGAMFIIQPHNINVYLPIFTSILFTWIPSPINHLQIQNLENEVSRLSLNSRENSIRTPISNNSPAV